MVSGLQEAQYVQNKIRQAGIQDVQLFWDDRAGIWAVCQVMKRGGILLPDSYAQDGIKPHIMFYIKNKLGGYRTPNDQDVIDVIATVHQSERTFEKGGDWLADQLDEQSADKDRKHRAKLKEKVHEIAPALKKAIKKEL